MEIISKLKLKSNLKEILNQRKMTIRELSDRIEYRFESVRMLYHGELLRIPVELIERTCTELEIDISDLFTLEHK